MFRYEDLPSVIMGFASYKMTIQGRSEKTVYNYCVDLCAFFRYLLSSRQPGNKNTVWDLKEEITEEFVGSVKEAEIYSYLLFCASTLKNKPPARARKLCAIKGFFKYLSVNAKLLPENIAKDIEAPKIPKTLPKFLTLEEAQTFLEAVRAHGKENAVRDYAIFTLFLNCGMRLNELCGSTSRISRPIWIPS